MLCGYCVARAVKRNIGRDRLRGETRDNRETENAAASGKRKKRAYGKKGGIKIKRTEAAGKQRAESYDSAAPSRPGNYWLSPPGDLGERDPRLFPPRFLSSTGSRPRLQSERKKKEKERKRLGREKKNYDGR